MTKPEKIFTGLVVLAGLVFQAIRHGPSKAESTDVAIAAGFSVLWAVCAFGCWLACKAARALYLEDIKSHTEYKPALYYVGTPPTRKRPSPWKASLPAVGLCVLLVALIGLSSQYVPRAIRPTAPDAPPLQLRDVFLSDFDTLLRLHSEVPFIVNGSQIQLTVQAYFDFSAKSEFIGFFIPSTVPSTYDVCVYLSGLDHAGSLKRTGVQTSGGVVGQMTDQNDLVFTGRVYIYYQADLSIEQRSALIKVYRAKRLDVQFRGNDYLIVQQLAKKNAQK